MAAKKPYSVSSKEFGRGKASVVKFATLQEAQDYVKSHWQGAAYRDGPNSFHSDYCTFTTKGFALAEIGKARWEAEWQCFEWDWTNLAEVAQDEPKAIEPVCPQVNSASDVSEEIPF